MEKRKLKELQEEELQREEEKLKEDRKKIKLDFTRKEYEYFCDNCMFSELQENILKDRIKDLSITQIALKNNLSEETIKRNIKKIKNKILKVI